MFCAIAGQRSKTADVTTQLVTSWAWLVVLTCIQCRADAGERNRCSGGVCSNHDNRMMAQYDQPISDTQVGPTLLTLLYNAGNSLHRPSIGEQRIVMSMSVCLFVLERISGITLQSSPIFVHVTYGYGSVFFWQRCDTLSTSGFVDYVMFAHKPTLLDVAAQLKGRAHAALGLAINCAR